MCIDFKHAVEFSSFGCVPRFGLAAAAWGNSINLRGFPVDCQIRVSRRWAIIPDLLRLAGDWLGTDLRLSFAPVDFPEADYYSTE